jgi:hypothetical protein
MVVVPAMQDRRLEEVAFSARLDYRHATGGVYFRPRMGRCDEKPHRRNAEEYTVGIP